jgi:uncharacterized membrane protein
MMATPASPAERLPALDQLRGLVMILMALDHTRDFFASFGFDPLDLTRTTPALFLTRWVTHFCAPVFVLLAGVGAYLYGARGRTRAQVSRFLLLRGLLLIVLELTVVNFGWHFDEQPGFFLLQVIWALGWCMVALAGLVWFPLWAIGVVGVAMIAGHNLLDGLSAASLSLPPWLWTVLHVPGNLRGPAGSAVFVLYPLVPWIGVMAAGYALGPLFLRPAPVRRRWLLGLGLALTLAFILVRLVNRYGDPQPWVPQRSPLNTLFAFINAEKYPPSLDFLLMTLGPALLALAWLDRPPGPIGWVLATYGRVPLLFYVLHIPVLHALARFGADGQRFDLPVVYAVWAGVAAALYFPCRAYAAFKARRREWVWKYL